MNKTAIEWTDFTWNPVTGCTKVSTGCANCYAEKIAHRFKGTKAFPEGFQVTLHPERLDEPLRRRKPARIFVNSMSDLFHPEVPDEFIAAVFGVMALCPHHVFQVLTKRPERMQQWVGSWQRPDEGAINATQRLMMTARNAGAVGHGYKGSWIPSWPLLNIWLGVSVEDQARADERIPLLLQTPAAVRFVSLEPLLGPVDDLYSALTGERLVRNAAGEYEVARGPRLDWLLIGAETGPCARSCDPAWVQSVIDQARAAGVPVFVKVNLRWPERIQEYPQIGGDVA